MENRESSALFRDIIIYPLYNNRTNVTTARERERQVESVRLARGYNFLSELVIVRTCGLAERGSSANYSYSGKNERGRVLRMKGPEGIKLCRIPALCYLTKRVARQIVNLVAIFDTIRLVIFSSPRSNSRSLAV